MRTTPARPSTPPPTGPSESQIDTTRRQAVNDKGSNAKLPHERDETTGATRAEPHPEGLQAHQDLKKGLVDTDARGKDGRPLGSPPTRSGP